MLTFAARTISLPLSALKAYSRSVFRFFLHLDVFGGDVINRD